MSIDANKEQEITELLEKVEKVAKKKDLDLSSGEDLSIAIMNLVSIEEHLFFTSQKTRKREYLDLLNEIRILRTELLKEIIKDYEGEQWCISKHLLATSMRLMEVGTKELKKGNKKKAWYFFEKAYNLYSLFWGINLDVVKTGKSNRNNARLNLINTNNKEVTSMSLFSKLGLIVKKAVDCCKE